MNSVAEGNRFFRSAKTFAVHVLLVLIVPFVAAIVVKSFVFGRGFVDFAQVVARQTAAVGNSIVSFQVGPVAGAMFYGLGIALLSYAFNAHKLWHVLGCWAACYLVLPYFIIDHDVGYSMYVALVAPANAFAALLAWAVSLRFWRCPS